MGPAALSPLGVGFLAVLVVTGWSGLTLVLSPCLALALIPQRDIARVVDPVYRRVTHFVQWAWMGNVAVLLEWLYGVRIHVTGDAATAAKGSMLLTGERALWIANHRTRIDWMLLWCLAIRTHSLAQLKIVLKAPLRNVPIFGWAMQHFLFIFLHRKWADDEVMLKTYLPFLADKEPQASYLLFPEGTDLSDGNREKSIAFAEKQGLPARQYSLYPRTTGWCFMTPILRRSVDAVYDITMFFVDHVQGERPSEQALLSGRMPRAIHFHVERLDIATLPQEKEELAAWLEERFKQKEAWLKAFYEQDGKLPDGAVPIAELDQHSSDSKATFVLVVAFWLVFVVFAVRMAWAFGIWSILFSVFVFGGHIALTHFGKGVDGHLHHKALTSGRS
ncbi:hypothetical protein PINS_up013968 [Pythium insidiosum]|nr:hypothetical protein PINS_up013968 [Pythium insidiosum]